MSRKVLIIEDDPVYGDMLNRYLLDRGFETSLAQTGHQAMESLPKVRPDIVLCDLNLPDISGLLVLERLLASSDPAPVIVISASDDMKDIREAVRLGAVDYLVKPVRQLDVLEYAIENCLTRSSLEESFEHERWELDDHLDVLFQDHAVVERLTEDLVPHDFIDVGRFHINHQLHRDDGEKLWIDYYRLPNEKAVMVMAHAQALAGQNVVSLLVLKTLFNPFLRSAMAGEHNVLMHPHHLLSRLNAELCHSRIRTAFDMVVVWIDAAANTAFWSLAGEKILLSHEGKADLALGIWNNATYRVHQSELREEGFYLACLNSHIRLRPR
ncbi:response regulator [Aliidiomarina sanyensis]|uniref:Response regulator n=1 Tax=Aliidiomarina sanyensis TaxID=1249555 RepID=A0A432WGF8_9GAMM|nr:response regulator [Aliidiomarina sanyensis]RUO32825.1 response regulator [Aliidiomarina sanyensis]